MDEPVIGIDLGTSNTVVAVVEGDRATVIPDREGRRIHPSVVSFHPKGTVLVGHEAKRRRVIDPKHTVASAKRLIGRTFQSEEVQAAAQRSRQRQPTAGRNRSLPHAVRFFNESADRGDRPWPDRGPAFWIRRVGLVLGRGGHSQRTFHRPFDHWRAHICDLDRHGPEREAEVASGIQRLALVVENAANDLYGDG